jgi:hypothetical protein
MGTGARRVRRLDQGIVGLVGARGADRLRKKCTRAQTDAWLCGHARPSTDAREGFGRFDWLGRLLGWLAGLGGGPMGPLPRVMNIVYIYILIKIKSTTMILYPKP